MANKPHSHSPSSILHPRPILLAGPTAVGKSQIALQLAGQLGGEIISADSMQVYRGLDIGTAKPSPAERARAPHHLIDICDLAESFDAAQFARLAHRAVAEIQSRGRVPILCGGTGLYFKAFLEGLGEMPPADPKLRAGLEAMPLENLLAELRERDPATFETIDKKNPASRHPRRGSDPADRKKVFRTTRRVEVRFNDSRPTTHDSILLFHAPARRFAHPHQCPRGRHVCARSGG